MNIDPAELKAVFGDISDRLTRLEQLVRTPGEQLSPNYLTVDAAGRVGAMFSGLINALGLILPASSISTPPGQSQIQWQRTSDGAVVAQIYAQDLGGAGGRAGVFRAAPDGINDTLATIQTGAGDGLFINTTPGVGSTIDIESNAIATRLIDASGRSKFLQLLGSAQQLQVATGVGTLVFPGGSALPPDVVITHGIGRVPVVLLGPTRTPDGFSVIANVSDSSVTSTQFTLTGFTPQGNPAAASVSVFWAAIG